MIEYNDIDEALKAACKYLLKRGVTLPTDKWQGNKISQKEKMRVVLNYSFICNTPNHVTDLQREGQPDLPWAEDHFFERIGGRPTNPGKTYKSWPYVDFKDNEDPYMDGEQFSHTYQERYFPKEANPGSDTVGDFKYINEGIRYDYGDFTDLIKHLEDNPTTRQAYLPVWFPEDTGVVHKGRVPCSLGYLFMPVGDYLHCNYYIRSCDLYRHFRNDVYLTMRLLQYVVANTNEMWKPGLLTMYIANFHYFDNDLYHIKKDKRWNLGE